ncbi:MAG: ATP-binding cassette domain-containing protein [Candidatus Omnitrophica bacterium]|nr:ATP-binding cassette domain-containing protein [Candidatus Omnitrophota bacterium]
MIFLNNLSKSYGSRILFENFSLTIDRGERIGLVGPNGAGKSTLFNIILKQNESSSGTIQINKGVRIGYLAQEVTFNSEATVLSELTAGDESIKKLKKEKDALEKENKAAGARYGAVLHDLEFFGYFDLEHRAKKILSGLGFANSDFNRPVNEMSGGFKMRVLLAKLLLYPYDILLLDEPTNFLDLEAAIWFKDYLLKFKGTFVMISHDRDFLTEVTSDTLVLENGAITKIKGNYDDYEKMCNEQRERLLKQFKEQDKKCKQLKVFINRFHAQPNKASQVRSKKRMLEKMDIINVPLDRKESIRKFNFPKATRSGYRAIELKSISKAYGDISVYQDFDFELTRGEKSVFIGHNGAGKSTLLKILAGVIDIDSGSRILGTNIDIGYFSQTRLDVLTPDNTVFEEAYSASGGRLTNDEIRTVLAAFLFTGDDVEKKVSILSGGEKSRLILAKLLINPPNFLLLDEPTTHLDVDAVEALIRALKEYDGTLVFISHDIHFVRSVANMVFEINKGRVRKFPGSFDYYWQTARHKDVVELKRKKIKSKSSPVKEMSEKDKEKKQKKENEKISKKIKALRKEKEDLELEYNVKWRVVSNPRSYHRKEVASEYSQRLKELKCQIAKNDQEIKDLKKLFK